MIKLSCSTSIIFTDGEASVLENYTNRLQEILSLLIILIEIGPIKEGVNNENRKAKKNN